MSVAAPGQDITGVITDPETGELVRSYAKALVNAAGGEAEAVVDELEELVADVLVGNPQFASILASPTMAEHDRDRLLTEVFEGRTLATSLRFLRILNRHDRLAYLRPIVAAARSAFNSRSNRTPVSVRSAVPLDEGQTAALTGRLAAMLGGTPILSTSVDPALIGGLVVQVGDDVYDASVRNHLQRLRHRLIEGNSHEIPGRRDQFSDPA